jgi:hypothetical protein
VNGARVALPQDLRRLAGLQGEARLTVAGPVTVRAVLDALAAAYPALRGTVRDPVWASAVRSCAFSPAART